MTIFTLEEELKNEPKVKSLKLQQPEPIEQIAESAGLAPTALVEESPVIEEAQPYVGQKVKLKLPDNPDCEVYQYMYYYCSHLMKKAGEITAINTSEDGRLVCTLDFHGTQLYFHSDNLHLL